MNPETGTAQGVNRLFRPAVQRRFVRPESRGRPPPPKAAPRLPNYEGGSMSCNERPVHTVPAQGFAWGMIEKLSFRPAADALLERGNMNPADSGLPLRNA